MTKERSVKIVNFMIIGAGGLMLGHGFISHYSENALSSTLYVATYFEKKFQSALNLGPNQRTLTTIFKVR